MKSFTAYGKLIGIRGTSKTKLKFGLIKTNDISTTKLRPPFRLPTPIVPEVLLMPYCEV